MHIIPNYSTVMNVARIKRFSLTLGDLKDRPLEIISSTLENKISAYCFKSTFCKHIIY